MSNSSNLTDVDWSTIPAPEDDGAAAHLIGQNLPSIPLPATNGERIDLSALSGQTVVYIYPMTGRPDRALPEGWDEIPGARGCTPQSCAFRDHATDLNKLGVAHLFGLSVQPTSYQHEAAERLHLPFPLLSDTSLKLAKALKLPTITVHGETLLRRLTMILNNGRIDHVFYPVFPPDRNAQDVVDWFKTHRL